MPDMAICMGVFTLFYHFTTQQLDLDQYTTVLNQKDLSRGLDMSSKDAYSTTTLVGLKIEVYKGTMVLLLEILD